MSQKDNNSTAVRKPIRSRITLGLFLLVFVICLIGGLLTYRGYYRTIQREYEDVPK